MKKTLLPLLLCAVSTSLFALNPTASDKQRCYMENDADSTITFLYPVGSGYFASAPFSSLYVRGSMNGWSNDERYRMTQDTESGCWYVTLPFDVMNVPGNAGHPEFKFYKDGSWVNTPSWLPASYRFGGNNAIVIFSDENIAEIDSLSHFAKVIRPLSDFDLSDSVDCHKISNFRRVPGTTCLYRSYHPYHAYRPQFDTEHARLSWIDSLATRAGIKNDICLSENMSAKLTTYTCGGKTYQEQFPAYYQDIINRNGVLYVGTQNGTTPSYNEVYYNSVGSKFGQWIAEVVDFIIDPANPGPFQIHCALGTDRTGVFSATLAALCGATWEEIAADYEQTNNMQIQEYRSKGLLAYSLRRMCGVYDVSKVPNLSQAIANYFIEGGFLTQAHIDCLRLKLNGTQPATIPDKYVLPTDTAASQYKTIVVKCYSPGGAPTIWWWNGGDFVSSASSTLNSATNTTFTWNTRPAMPSVQSAWEEVGMVSDEDIADWYYWCFTQVDARLGIDYIFTAANCSKSSDLNAKESECRNQQYVLSDECPSLPYKVYKQWLVSDSLQFGKVGTVYVQDTVIDGLTLHCGAEEACRFRIESANETLAGQPLLARGYVGNAGNADACSYLSLKANMGERLVVYAQSNHRSELHLALNGCATENIVETSVLSDGQIAKLEYDLPANGIYYLFTQSADWYFYGAELLSNVPAESTRPMPTDINAVIATQKTSSATKIVCNGQVIICIDGAEYTMLGVRL